MKKIMFVMEDYNEMVFVETVLKKIGFDCMGLQNDVAINDKILGFSPALLIADGFGRKTNGLLLCQKIKRTKGFPKIILVTASSPLGFFILPVGVVGEMPTRIRANFSVLSDLMIDSTPLCPPDDLLKEILAFPNGRSRSS